MMSILIRVYKYSKLQILVVPLFYSMYIFFLFMFQSIFRISDTAFYVLIKKNSMFLKTLASTFTGIPIATIIIVNKKFLQIKKRNIGIV